MDYYNEPSDISMLADGQNGDNIFPTVTFMGNVSINTSEAVGAIEEALTQVGQNLAEFAASETFEADMLTVFGESADVELGRTIIEALAVGGELPEITVVPEEQMNGANGGYDPLTGEVYLADAVVGESPNLADVLTEELGHYIDSEVNEFDTTGDEGEHFAALVDGDELSEAEIERLRGEDDTVEILDGLVVEASSELTFESKTFPTGDGPKGIAVADFDGDGIEEIVVANYESDTVSVLFGDGKGNMSTAPVFKVGGRPVHVAVEDFNRDGNQDIATTNLDDDTIAVLLGDGRGAFSTPSQFDADDRPFGLAVADVNRDRKLDIVTANTNSNTVSILQGNGDGSFASGRNYPVKGNVPAFVAVEDFSGDRNYDIVVTNYSSDNISVLLGNKDNTFSFLTNFAIGGEIPIGIVAEDFNGDKKLDIAMVTRGSNSISVMPGVGGGRFGFPNNFAVGESPRELAVGDLNGDRKLDLVVANTKSDNISVLLGEGKGRFGTAINFGVGDAPVDVLAEDLNNDGKLDIVVTNQDSDTISILTNTTKTGTTNPKIAISNTRITEGNRGRKNAQFAVTLDSESSETVKVNYATANQTAKAGKDYRKTNGTLTFKPGQTKKTVTVPVFGDTLEEGNEKFKVNLSKPRNAKFGDRRGIGIIRDNDKVVPQLSIGDARVTEGDDGRKQAKFTVTLNAKADKTVRVNYVTGNGSADAGEDYRRTTGSLTFKPGQRRKTITVPVFGDIIDEKNEKFKVTLRKPRNAKLEDKTGIGTIRDND